MSQQSQDDSNEHPQTGEASPVSPKSVAKPAPLFTAGHEGQAKEWPFVERRRSDRRENEIERRESEDRRNDDRRDDERRSQAERRTVIAPVDNPELKLEEGGLWPSLDWRPGNRKLDDRRASDRRAEERRAGKDRRQSGKDRRQGDRRAAGTRIMTATELEDDDDLADAGNYKGGLD